MNILNINLLILFTMVMLRSKYDLSLILLLCLFTILLQWEFCKLYFPTETEDLYKKLKRYKIINMILAAPIYAYDILTELPFMGKTTYYVNRFIMLIGHARLFLMYYYVPLLIVATAFVVDTWFFQIAFDKIVYLLIIPFFIRSMIYVLKPHAREQMALHEQYFTVIIEKHGEGVKLEFIPKEETLPSLRERDPLLWEALCVMWYYYYLLDLNITFIEDDEFELTEFSSYVRIYCYFCYFIGLAFLLITNY